MEARLSEGSWWVPPPTLNLRTEMSAWRPTRQVCAAGGARAGGRQVLREAPGFRGCAVFAVLVSREGMNCGQCSRSPDAQTSV